MLDIVLVLIQTGSQVQYNKFMMTAKPRQVFGEKYGKSSGGNKYVFSLATSCIKEVNTGVFVIHLRMVLFESDSLARILQ